MIPLRKIPLRTGPGWREIHPRPTPWKIAWEGGGAIHIADTAFEQVLNGGPAGAVESPLAYAPETNRLYRYYCPSLSSRDRENGLLSVNPENGCREMAFPLHPLRTAPWMLHKVPDHPYLLALVVTDASRPERPGIVLQHQLGIFHLAERKSLLRNLPTGCQHPVAASPETDRLLFHGPDGYQILNLKGHRRRLLSDPTWGNGRGGAAFHPRQSALVIGGIQMALHEPEGTHRRELVPGGCFPVWTPDEQSLLFATSSSDLHCYHLAEGSREEIVSIPANRYPELKKARPAAISPDGRYFALPITRRSPLHPETVRADLPSWSEHQTLLIGDFYQKEVWQYPGPVDYCTWAGKLTP